MNSGTELLCVVTDVDTSGDVRHEVHTYKNGLIQDEGTDTEENEVVRHDVIIKQSDIMKSKDVDLSVKSLTSVLECEAYCLTPTDVEKCKDINIEYIREHLNRIVGSFGVNVTCVTVEG